MFSTDAVYSRVELLSPCFQESMMSNENSELTEQPAGPCTAPAQTKATGRER